MPKRVFSPDRVSGRLALAVFAAALGVCACNDDDSATRLQITELDPRFAVAGEQAFDLRITGTGFDRMTEVIWDSTAQPTRYVSGRTLIATISAADIARPKRARLYVIQESGVAFENDFRSLSVIFPVIPKTIDVAPDMPALTVGETVQFEVTGTLANGESTNVSPLMDWTTSRVEVATVDQTGLVRAVAPGSTTITAAFTDFPSLSQSTTLTVAGP